MTKEVLLTISGLHLLDGEDGNVEMVTAADYYLRNGKHYVLYDEVVEGMSGHISNTIKIGENSLEVLKKGLTSTRLVFEKGKIHVCAYRTPYGLLELGVEGRELSLREEENAIDVHAEYVLKVGDESLSNCTIELRIRPREAENLRLGS